jgi:ATP-dependent Clp protease adapter protein ClpS
MKADEIVKGPEVVVADPDTKSRSDIKPKKPASYMCMLHNDDYTDGEALVDLIARYFRHDVQTATQIVLLAHQQGNAPCGGPYSKDIAETKAKMAMDAAEMHPSIGGGPAPLMITVEKIT